MPSVDSSPSTRSMPAPIGSASTSSVGPTSAAIWASAAANTVAPGAPDPPITPIVTPGRGTAVADVGEQLDQPRLRLRQPGDGLGADARARRGTARHRPAPGRARTPADGAAGWRPRAAPAQSAPDQHDGRAAPPAQRVRRVAHHLGHARRRRRSGVARRRRAAGRTRRGAGPCSGTSMRPMLCSAADAAGERRCTACGQTRRPTAPVDAKRPMSWADIRRRCLHFRT